MKVIIKWKGDPFWMNPDNLLLILRKACPHIYFECEYLIHPNEEKGILDWCKYFELIPSTEEGELDIYHCNYPIDGNHECEYPNFCPRNIIIKKILKIKHRLREW